MIITLTAGTGLIMWLGELVTEQGVGNGMSLLIFTSIAARLPGLAVEHPQTATGSTCFVIVVALGLVIMALVVFVEQSQRRIPVQYAKRMVGRRMYGGTSTYIPIKVNMAGVIPVIFAVVAALPAGPDRPVPAGQHRGLGHVDQTTPDQRRPPALHRPVLPADRLLHLLLRRDHVQPRRGRGEHEEVRRLHPRHPGRPADGRVPRLRPHPHHAAGRDLPRPHRAASRSSPWWRSTPTSASPSAAPRS